MTGNDNILKSLVKVEGLVIMKLQFLTLKNITAFTLQIQPYINKIQPFPNQNSTF